MSNQTQPPVDALERPSAADQWNDPQTEMDDAARHALLRGTLLESMPLAVVTTDANGRILYTNARLETLFGYSRDELENQPIEVLIPERFRKLHVQHRQRYMEEPHMRSMGSGMDLSGRRKDGSEFPIEAGLSYVNTANGPIIISSITDISRRKQTEEMLELRVRERTRELERRREVSDGLRDTLTILNSNRTQDEILDHVTIQACRLLFADASAIYSIRGDSRTFTLETSHGLPGVVPGDEAPAFAAVQAQGTHLSSTGERMHIVAVERDDQAESDLFRTDDFRALLSVPLIVKDEIYGTLMLYYAEPRKFSPEEIELAMTVGDQAALAIENARLRTQVERAAVAAERNRIARDLHDSVTQTLFSATLIAEVLPRLWHNNLDESERRLGELRQLTRGALAEMRTLLLELRPATLIEVDIAELLRQLTEAVTGRARVPIVLETIGVCEPPPDVKIALYHIAQEALNNVAKHARARRASVILTGTDGRISLQVDDDGRGFVIDEVTPEHLGLTIMHERAEGINAHLEIQSEVGNGTKVRVQWEPEISERKQL
jgi:PAS domain S-box-containing protein